MTIHKLAPDRSGAATPFNVSVSFQHDLDDLSEAIVKTRVIQAFDNAAARYPIHRQIRCSVANDQVQQVFDDVALNAGLAPQRLDTGKLLLDGDGVFVSATGYRKGGYCSCTFKVWAVSKEVLEQTRRALLHSVGPYRERDQMFVIDWNFCNNHGLYSTTFDEVADDVLLDEAYPNLGTPVNHFVEGYLSARETVLILLGPPGMGKTRLVRAILGAMSKRKRDSALAMYTADKRALEGDEIFVDFITGDHDAFIIEDADHMLQARTDGNRDLHRFLMISDGVVRAQNRKVIFTTNLPNIGSIDEALLRPGRCFATLQMRPLREPEAEALLQRLLPGDAEAVARARASLFSSAEKAASVASIYRAAQAAGSDLRR